MNSNKETQYRTLLSEVNTLIMYWQDIPKPVSESLRDFLLTRCGSLRTHLDESKFPKECWRSTTWSLEKLRTSIWLNIS